MTEQETMDRLQRASSGFIEAKLLLTGAALRLFDHLRGPGARVADLAARLGADARGTAIVLDALTALGYVRKDGETYTNAPEFEPFLVEDGPTHFVAGLRHRNRLFRHWAFLEERLTGQPLPPGFVDRATLTDAQDNENFIRAMYAYSHQNVGPVVGALRLEGVTSVADLGGGPGHYLAEFGRRLPEARLFLVDLPLTLDVARKIQADSPDRQRMRFVEWDFYNDPAPAGFGAVDLLFVSQVIHSEPPEANQALFARLFEHVHRGGRLVINERVVDAARTAPREAALFAVNMYAMTAGGRSYTEAEITGWAAAAGFRNTASVQVSETSHVLEFTKRD